MSGHPDPTELVRGIEPGRARRRTLLAHLQCCVSCRAELAAVEPERLFSLLALEPVPAAVLDDVSLGVAKAVDREGRGGGRPAVAWASLAASLLLAAVLGTTMFNEPRVMSGVSGPEVIAERTEPSASMPVPAVVPAAMIEVIESPGSPEVVELSVGDVELVMIFDEAFDI